MDRSPVELPFSSSQPPERILFIKPSSLGDIIHALPVLHGLRTRHPQARIDWLVGKPFAALLEGHPEINELILFDRRRFARVGTSPRVAWEFVRFVRGLRARKYDLVIDLQGLFRTGFLARACGAKVRIGFADAREGASLFYTHRVRVENPNIHAVDRNYRVASLLDFEEVPLAFSLMLPEALRTATADRLCAMGLHDGIHLVAVVPGARWETKVWPAERFTETIDQLHNEERVRCILLGGPDEQGLCGRIVRLCHKKPINLAGQTTVRELAAIISLANVVLCHDSAAMHLAVALDRPLVCLVGPTNPHRTGPYRRMKDVVQLDLDCSPCYFRRLSQCPYDHRCMRDLDAARVVAAVRASLGHPVTNDEHGTGAALQAGEQYR